MNKAVDRQFVVWRDRAEAAEAELERVRKENKEATRTKDQLLIAANIWQDRTEKAEAERDAMKAAAEKIASQMLSAELIEEHGEEFIGDFEEAYDSIIRLARTAINASGTSKEGG